MALAPAFRLAALVATLASLAACAEESPRATERGPDPTLVSLPEGGGELAGSRIDPLFGDAADAITEGRFSFEVRCWTPDDWREVMAYWESDLGGPAAGFILGLSDVQLSPDVCGPLTDFAYGPARVRRNPPARETAFALTAFAHEIGHSIVGTNEAATQCWAMQRVGTVARVLGASERSASAVGRSFFTEIYPRMPAEYRSDECRYGGAFDETPGDGSWP